MISAITMTIPVVLVVFSLTAPHSLNRRVNIFAALFFFCYYPIGIGKYSGTYDGFLLAASLIANALTVWYTWKRV
jgi:hypothetical protein